MSDSPFTVEDEYIQHNLIKDERIGYREYQKEISEIGLRESSLIALPTAAGKTIIAAMIAAERLNSNGGRILFLAPNKPLVTQQAEEFQRVLDLFEEDIVEMTGDVRPDDREEIWKNGDARIVFATPQVIENDILSKRLDLTDITQIIFDECHRATGGYAYTFIAEEYNSVQSDDKKLITGLSASPGSSEQDILQLCDTLGVTNVEIFSADHELLKDHVTTPDITPRKVDIDEEIHDMRDLLQEACKDCYKKLKKEGYLDSARKALSFGELQQARGKIKKDLDRGKSEAYEAMSIHAEAMKLYQAVKIIDTQGVSALVKYLDRQFEEAKDSDSSKAVKRMCRRDKVKDAYDKAKSYDKLHPKKTVLRTYLIDTVVGGGQMILFTEYTDTAEDLVEFINSHDGIDAKKFVGQQEMSQKEQQNILNQFREGDFDVLVATSVGEEGLDIPAASMVVFYEPVGSSLRTIQRRGRTARKGEGEVIILIGKGTRDEGRYYASKSNEDTMKDELSELSESEESIKQLIADRLETPEDEEDEEDLDDGQASLDGFVSEDEEDEAEDVDIDVDVEDRDLEEVDTPDVDMDDDITHIIADSRETKSNVVRELYDMDDVQVDPETIEVGDFIAGPDTVIERKETSDLVSTLTGDRDIFEQVQNMVNSYERAVLLVEGSTEELYSKGVHPNAIRGLLDAVTNSFNVDIFYTTGEEDTARWIKTISERAQKDESREVSAHGKKQTQTMNEQQEYVVSSIADIGPVTARSLLDKFGTVERVFNASSEELQEVDGVGEKTADGIRDVLTSEYEES
jgi:Fanconi anemia group M protein